MNHGSDPFTHLAGVLLYLAKRSFGQSRVGCQPLEALLQVFLSVKVYPVKEKCQDRRHQNEQRRERLTPVMHRIPLFHKRLRSAFGVTLGSAAGDLQVGWG